MAKKISVIIPNYNGQNLLARNLPQVLKACQNCEVIVVDDGSTDDSVEFLRQNFPKVKLTANDKNQGFIRSVNRGVQAAKGDLVLLLNSDVYPHANFLKPLTVHFEKVGEENNIFAVACADYSHEGDKIVVRGKGGATFTKGFVNHFAANIIPGETLWVSGGSGLFDRQKFLELDGFDPVFAPFYWEDIDLSYRAYKRGWKVLFDPAILVEHHHESTIGKYFAKKTISTIAFRNQFIFIWKNITDGKLLLFHMLFLPILLMRLLFGQAELLFSFFHAIGKLHHIIKKRNNEIAKQKVSDKEVLQFFIRE